MTNNGVALSAQEVEPWGFGFFPVHSPLHFIIILTPCILHFIEMTKKVKNLSFVLQQTLTPKYQ